MTKRNPKLELTWIGKENRPKLEPRILLEDPDKSYHAPHDDYSLQVETLPKAPPKLGQESLTFEEKGG